jgi:hypothetical protein
VERDERRRKRERRRREERAGEGRARSDGVGVCENESERLEERIFFSLPDGL